MGISDAILIVQDSTVLPQPKYIWHRLVVEALEL